MADGEAPGAEGEPVSDDAPASVDPKEEHRNDGLDLARSIARSYRGSRGAPGSAAGRTPRRRRRPRPSAPESSGSHPDDRDPQTLDAAMERLVAEHGWKTDVAVHALFGRWDLLVGADVAQHCSPHRFVDGELQVRADSTAWATQLRLLASTVIARMNEQLGDGTVLRITVVGPQSPSWKKGARSVRGRGPRDTYG